MADSFTAAELAQLGLSALPRTKRRITARAVREAWPFVERLVAGNVARAYPEDTLPADVRVALAQRALVEQTAPTSAIVAAPAVDVAPKHREKAQRRLDAVVRIAALVASGVSIRVAARDVGQGHAGMERSLRRWYALVKDAPRAEWFGLLVPKYSSATSRALECHPEAWSCFRDDYLRPARPAYAESYERMIAIAAHQSWSPVPSLKTLIRRIEKLPRAMVILRREGREVLERYYPPQERSTEHFGALGGVTADGHKFDVLVRWPGVAEPVRVMMVAYQDLYSGKILSWRVDQSEHANLARLALSDLVIKYGIPNAIWLDNGRAWASKKMTGGAAHRFRFKVREEDAVGILPSLDVKVHFTRPYHGQAKPIERAFRDLCGSIAKHPAFEGAYTGNSPTTKPFNYGSRVVELADFIRVVEAQIRAHNAKQGRRKANCKRRSFDDTFNESYATREIRKLTQDQHRLLLLAAEGLTVRTADASIHMMGNRFWCEELIALAGERVVVRFDPHHMQRGIHVYRPDGRYVGFAECKEASGFDDVDAAKHHEKKRREWSKAVAKVSRVESTFHPDELGQMHLRAQGAPDVPPSARVIKPLFNAPATPPAAVLAQTRAELDEREALEDFILSVGADARAKLRASNE